MSGTPMVEVNGVRYRTEDAIRLGLVNDPAKGTEVEAAESKAADKKLATRTPNKARTTSSTK